MSKAEELASLIVRSDVGSQLINRQEAAKELRRLESENKELKDGLVKARQLIRELTNK